jgi:hypothetical protein
MAQTRIRTTYSPDGRIDTCLVQPSSEDGLSRVDATCDPNGDTHLTGDAWEDFRAIRGWTLTLTTEGMATLVEMWALRHPQAFARLAEKVHRAQAKQL